MVHGATHVPVIVICKAQGQPARKPPAKVMRTNSLPQAWRMPRAARDVCSSASPNSNPTPLYKAIGFFWPGSVLSSNNFPDMLARHNNQANIAAVPGDRGRWVPRLLDGLAHRVGGGSAILVSECKDDVAVLGHVSAGAAARHARRLPTLSVHFIWPPKTRPSLAWMRRFLPMNWLSQKVAWSLSMGGFFLARGKSQL